MVKFLINLLYLFQIKTPIKIVINFIKNFFLNYKTKRKSKKIETNLYQNFQSKYNHRWFCTHLNFLTFNLKKNQNIKRILEIGSYEGLSAIFYLNLFKDSSIECVDTWSGGEQQPGEDFSFIEKNFDKNLNLYKNKVLKHKMLSDNFFAQNKNKFDLIFIDGDHKYDQVKRDALNAWKILNNRGVLIFDDYTYNHYKKETNLNPAPAINEFIKNFSNEISKFVIWKQVIIFKK